MTISKIGPARISVIGFAIILIMLVVKLWPDTPILAMSDPSPDFGQVFPKDDSNEDLSFLEFKLNLLKAIQNKDLKFIDSIITPETKLSFGGQSGADGLEQLWKLKTNSDTKFWSILEKTIKLGCVSKETPNGKWYYAPYTYANFYGDGFQSLIVLGYDVNLRAKPDSQAEVLEQLDYEVVQIYDSMQYNPEQKWVRVKTSSGRNGYIAREYLISPLYYRAGFKKVEGQWKMLFFVSGD